ncbi:benzoate-CoA ligase family protein [Quadrisphaera sp. DSM 44207]|uniref:benzoate-CoA ligase family protein n=1 Tax=Quadrisphaera sp. DSM 44207 TaxID=1881057 RepID=UPI00088746A2|nr:benzoate-CoA ligase family protein [Quadrisphaera sp. DSM 44207]SDQ07062.1 benzoate-CoA ligase [Quadrisphaera sp. DSM 44207]
MPHPIDVPAREHAREVPAEVFNAAGYLVDRHVAAGDGARVAVRCGAERVTYQELQERSARFAAGLATLSVREGDRVVLVVADRTELLVGLLGAWRHGAVAVPVSTMLTGDDLAAVLVDCGARVVVVSPECADVVSRAAPQAAELEHAVTVGGAGPTLPDAVGTITWEELLDAGRRSGGPAEPAPTPGDAQALWLYTSGTTGRPKAAMHRHASIRTVCEGYAHQVLGIGPDDVCYSVAKVFFAYGLGNSVLFPLSVAATTVLEPRRPTPQVVREVVAEHAPTLFFSVPTSYAAMLAEGLPRQALAGVRLAVSAGEVLPAALGRRVSEHFGVEVLDGIGSTEALHIFSSNRAGAVRPGTAGTPVPGYDLQLRDERGDVVPDGVPGALFVRGSSIASGYWRRPEATRSVFRGEWLATGDTCVRSADGAYTWLGRSDDMIKAGGIWVSPTEVEGHLLQHPDVAQAAVVAMVDEDGLDKPVACVVPAPGSRPDPDALVDWCREGLAGFKRPRAVFLVEDLPKTTTGKVQRFRLRQDVDSRLGRPRSGRA